MCFDHLNVIVLNKATWHNWQFNMFENITTIYTLRHFIIYTSHMKICVQQVGMASNYIP